MKRKSNIVYILTLPFLFLCTAIQSIKIDRVILATDAHPNYIVLWPFAALFWKEIIGVEVTLALIAHEDVTVDERFGEVIRFTPIPGIKTSLQAQTIRLLLAAYYPEEVCVISDIDMMPVNRSYFTDKIKHIPNDNFVVYHDKAYGNNGNRYQMCYCAGKGKLYKEIFGIHNPNIDIPNIIRQWSDLGLGWSTDEKMLTKLVKKWKYFKTKCSLLGGTDIGKTTRRISRRHKFNYDKKLLKQGHYIDMHVCRPVDEICYKKILGLMRDLGLDEAIETFGLSKFPEH